MLKSPVVKRVGPGHAVIGACCSSIVANTEPKTPTPKSVWEAHADIWCEQTCQQHRGTKDYDLGLLSPFKQPPFSAGERGVEDEKRDRAQAAVITASMGTLAPHLQEIPLGGDSSTGTDLT